MFSRSLVAAATLLAMSSLLLLTTGCGGKKDAGPNDKTMRVTVDVTGMT